MYRSSAESKMCEYEQKCWRYWYSVEMKRKPYVVPPTREELFLSNPIPVSTMPLKKSLYCENMPSLGHEGNTCPSMISGKEIDCFEYQKE